MKTMDLAARRENADLLDPDALIEEINVPASVDRAEVDMQITTAKTYPRSIRTFKDRALAMATLDDETAESCIYSLPRGGKSIDGPSVRLAELCASAWGNLRADTRIVSTDDKFITAEALCWDLEANVAIRCQVRRRITGRNGRRYDDDMIGVTGNAAASIALRNAIFRVIPGPFVRAIYREARAVAVGDAKTLSTKRAAAVEYLGKMGVTADRICAALDKPSIEDITVDDLALLKGMANRVKEGESAVDDLFPDPKAKAEAEARAAAKSPGAIADAIEGKAKAPPEPDPAPPQADLDTQSLVDDVSASIGDTLPGMGTKGSRKR